MLHKLCLSVPDISANAALATHTESAAAVMTPIEEIDLTGLHVLDGGMATELEAHGLDLSGPLWSAKVLTTAPDRVRAVHLDYLEAGADVLLTASYQVSRIGYRSALKAADALRLSVELTQQARSAYTRTHPRRVLIAASLGPYGAALHNGAEYHGNYDLGFAALVNFHRERIAVLAETGADLIAFETIPSLEEAGAVLAALHEFPVAAWISFTCRDGESVAHGEPVAACAALAASAPNIQAVGVNCTAPAHVSSLLAQMRRATQKPLVAYPNSGEPWDAAGRCWTGGRDAAEGAANWTALAREWQRAGAQIIGGCCRTTPAHIRAVCRALLPLAE